jgi:hypothetical protein
VYIRLKVVGSWATCTRPSFNCWHILGIYGRVWDVAYTATIHLSFSCCKWVARFGRHMLGELRQAVQTCLICLEELLLFVLFITLCCCSLWHCCLTIFHLLFCLDEFISSYYFFLGILFSLFGLLDVDHQSSISWMWFSWPGSRLWSHTHL